MFEINGEKWKICFCEPNDEIFITSDGSRTIGVTDDITKTVYIARGLNRKLFKHVLCHEIVHTICFSYNIYMSLEAEEMCANMIATYGKEALYVTRDIIAQLKMSKALTKDK